MSSTLIIRLRQEPLKPDSLVQWWLFDEQHNKLDATTTMLSELAAVVKAITVDYQTIVFAGAEDNLLTRVAIPSKQLKQVKQALPFMVEEQIAEEIESVHLALPGALDLSRAMVDVAVVKHSVLIHWLDLLHSHDLSPASITVDTLCVPRDEHCWSLIIDESRLLIRTGDNAGFACEIADTEMMLSAMLRELQANNEPTVMPAINLIQTRDAEADQSLMSSIASYIQTHFADIDVKHSHYKHDSGELLASHYLQSLPHTLNVLQGGYRVGNTENHWQRWSLAASIAGIGLALYLLLSVGSGYYFSQQAQYLDREAIALYKRIFPHEQRVISPRKQMQNHLRTVSVGANGSRFLPLLAQTAKQFESVATTDKLAVQQLRFDSERNDLHMQIQSKSIEQLDQFKQLLADAGLSVDIHSATEQHDNVIGRLVVRKM